jgi:hypothetical protein
MTKVLNRPLHIHTNETAALKVNDTTVINSSGQVVADITAPAGSIGTAELASLAVTAAKIAADAVETAKIKDGNVTTAKLAADAVDGTKLADDAVSLEHLDPAITPSHLIKFAGTHSYGGGGTSDAATVTGVAATDIVFATIKASTNAASIVKAVPTTNTVTFHFSTDPGASTEVFYQVINAAA